VLKPKRLTRKPQCTLLSLPLARVWVCGCVGVRAEVLRGVGQGAEVLKGVGLGVAWLDSSRARGVGAWLGMLPGPGCGVACLYSSRALYAEKCLETGALGWLGVCESAFWLRV
jgi:hypothetical protein